MDIQELIFKNRAGSQVGLPSFCTANETVLRALLKFAVERHLPILIEATCNQVNQDGGYTGMQPQDFVTWLSQLSEQTGISDGQMLLGGDHLGPNPWRKEPVDQAMAKAEVLVREYAKAGFRKIHLDASMACGQEPRPSFAEIARRAARLCRVAEKASPDPSALIYVIGTEVPVPGGETDEMSGLQITSPERLEQTIETHQQAFHDEGVEDAWSRVVSVVTQPGVDFNHTSVHRFEPNKAKRLASAIQNYNGLTFEGHSTDYQPTSSLGELVSHHVFFLKVGPELTFRFREGVFALAAIEDLLYPETRSNLKEVVDAAMAQSPGDWDAYYTGTPKEVRLLQHFSLSDRIRYYWQAKGVPEALSRLFENLAQAPLNMGVVTQYFGAYEFAEVPADAVALCERHVQRAAERYYRACGLLPDLDVTRS